MHISDFALLNAESMAIRRRRLARPVQSWKAQIDVDTTHLYINHIPSILNIYIARQTQMTCFSICHISVGVRTSLEPGTRRAKGNSDVDVAKAVEIRITSCFDDIAGIPVCERDRRPAFFAAPVGCTCSIKQPIPSSLTRVSIFVTYFPFPSMRTPRTYGWLGSGTMISVKALQRYGSRKTRELVLLSGLFKMDVGAERLAGVKFSE